MSLITPDLRLQDSDLVISPSVPYEIPDEDEDGPRADENEPTPPVTDQAQSKAHLGRHQDDGKEVPPWPQTRTEPESPPGSPPGLTPRFHTSALPQCSEPTHFASVSRTPPAVPQLTAPEHRVDDGGGLRSLLAGLTTKALTAQLPKDPEGPAQERNENHHEHYRPDCPSDGSCQRHEARLPRTLSERTRVSLITGRVSHPGMTGAPVTNRHQYPAKPAGSPPTFMTG